MIMREKLIQLLLKMLIEKKDLEIEFKEDIKNLPQKYRSVV